MHMLRKGARNRTDAQVLRVSKMEIRRDIKSEFKEVQRYLI